ncbi:response regulator transcription factor [Kribbella sp. NPDC004875]|uniref:response regulator transcription factor n=1 Tax=Kribbella sp. NPDC004875 TaxID=3364107 RepID=UPI003677252B
MRCVIVDDSRPFLNAARGLLVREGVTVVGTASTTAEATVLIAQSRPDVVLVDIDLGGESGFELITRLHAAGATAPMILISGHAEQDYADLIAASPAIGFVAKTSLSAGAIRRLLDAH